MTNGTGPKDRHSGSQEVKPLKQVAVAQNPKGSKRPPEESDKK